MVVSLSTQRTILGHQLPAKKSYKAMQSFYESINDKGTAQEYRFLHDQAKSRLHYQKSKKALKNGIEKLDKIMEADEKNPSYKNIYKFGVTMIKSFLSTAYEKTLSAYYYHKL